MTWNRFSSGNNYRMLSLLAVVALLIGMSTAVSAHAGEDHGSSEVETAKWDFGDAPDLPYPSRLFSNGARHRNVSKAWLGEGVDKEKDSRQVDRDGFDQGLEGTDPVEVKVVNKKYEGALYLNLLADRDMDGKWEKEEWMVENEKVDIGPGESETLEFQDIDLFGEKDREESVVRLTLTGRKIEDYRGMGEFDIGETEDYMLDGGLDRSACEKEYPGGTGIDIETKNSGLGWEHGREVEIKYSCSGAGCSKHLLEDAEILKVNRSADITFDREDPGTVSAKEHGKEGKGEIEIRYQVRSQPVKEDNETRYCSSDTFNWKGSFFHNDSLVPPELAGELRHKNPELIDDLHTGLRGYNNATEQGEVPPSAKKFLFSKMVGKIDHGEGETLVKMRMEPGKSLQMKNIEMIDREKLDQFDPEVIVAIEDNTLREMVRSSQPFKTFRTAWKKGSINVEGQGVVNGFKYGILEFIGRMASRINDAFTESIFEVGEGDVKHIDAGEKVLEVRKSSLGQTTVDIVDRNGVNGRDLIEPEDKKRIQDLVSRIKEECSSHPVPEKCVGVIDEEGTLHGTTIDSLYKLVGGKKRDLSMEAGLYLYPDHYGNSGEGKEVVNDG